MSQERPDFEKKSESDSPADSAQHQANNRLMAFLDEMHAQMPDVPEEDVQEDIEQAIAAVRDRPIE